MWCFGPCVTNFNFIWFFSVLFYFVHRINLGFQCFNKVQVQFFVLFLSMVFALLWPLELTDLLFKHTAPPGLFIDLWFLFLLGVFAYLAITHQAARLVLMMSVVCLLTTDSLACVVGSITALIFFLVGLVNRLETWLSWKWLQFLGLISYSLYLSHDIIGVYLRDTGLHLANKYVNLNSDVFVYLWVWVCIIICIVFASLLHRYIEKPTHQWSRRFANT